MSSAPLLSGSDSIGLADRAKLGDAEAKEELICLFLDWVRRRAHYYRSEFPQADTDRLIRSGIQGLLRSVEEHDPCLGISFKRWAFQLIFVMMDKELQRQTGAPTTLVPGRRKAQKYVDAGQSLAKETGLPPKMEDVRVKLGWSYPELCEALRPMNDRPGPVPGREALSGLAGLVQVAGQYGEPSTDDLKSWMEALSEVGEKGREILELRHGLAGKPPMTLRAIGRQFGLSYERIRIIEQWALDRLRRRACDRGLLDRFWMNSA